MIVVEITVQMNEKGLCAIRYCMRYKYMALGEYLLEKQTKFEAAQRRLQDTENRLSNSAR